MLWWLLGGLCFLLLLLLLVPITLVANFNNSGALRLELTLSWGFFKVKRLNLLPLSSPDKEGKRGPPKASRQTTEGAPRKAEKVSEKPQEKLQDKPKKKDAAKKAARKKREPLPLTWSEIHELAKITLPKVKRALHFKWLSLDFVLAVDDPAIYGWSYAFLAASAWLAQTTTWQVMLSERYSLLVGLKARIRLFPAQWLGLGISLMMHPTLRVLWWNKLFKKGEKSSVEHKSVHRTAGEPYLQ